MMKRAVISFLMITLLVGGFAFAQPANASYYTELQKHGLVFAEICTSKEPGSCSCRDSGNCSLEDVLQVFVNISNLILAIVGSLVLALMIYGGFLWLTSAGNQEKVTKGQKAMTGAMVGLFIVLGAFVAINFISDALGIEEAKQKNKCELLEPEKGGHSGEGWLCLDNTKGKLKEEGYKCEPNLCPGGVNIQCCILPPKEASAK